ncbi:AAA family ATPase [Planococcus maitriensis]|uniref:ATPase AAA-type core domain-containing protein n=1 Tax=Planococcus maitriensis TaxID=221799 RepID=A0A365K3T4_9BACL|nr:AAA family ATPase [Planococcus maitriensis]RAZ67271.1 hypothetical protein DP119_10930 [Planococcus maitriensis]
MDNFTLKYLFIKHKTKTLFDVNFSEENDNRTEPLTTIVIGENGSGKSHLLTVISEIFRGLNNLKRKKESKFRYDYYRLSYQLNNSTFDLEIFKNQVKFKQDKVPIDLSNVLLPNNILAVSFMINDKFTFSSPDQNNDDAYSYIGVRRTSNATWTTTLVKKITNSLILNLHDHEFSRKVLEILRFLNFEPEIRLNFVPVNKTLFLRKTSNNYLNAKVNALKKKNYFRSDAISKYSQESISNLVKFINTQVKLNKNDTDVSSNMIINIDLKGDSNWTDQEEKFTYLNMLVELQLLKSPELLLLKFDEFDFEYASSGEKHLLFTLINLAAEIRQSSIIFIDEPELSLHPNWQMKYISILKRLFNDYASCHFLIATHSHYLISDLKQDSSSIVHITIENLEKGLIREAKLLDMDTYAWSAENILYNIFGVRTTRNYYFEQDLRKLISFIETESKDIESIEKLLKKLESLQIDAADPLKTLITEGKEYVENVSANKR